MPSPENLTDQSVAAPCAQQHLDSGTDLRLLLADTWKGMALAGGGLLTAVSVAYGAGGAPLARDVMVAYLLLWAMGMAYVVVLRRQR